MSQEQSSSGLVKISFVVRAENMENYELAARIMHARGLIPNPDVREIAFLGFKKLIKDWLDVEEDAARRQRIAKPMSVRDKYLDRPGQLRPPSRKAIGELD
jgi:hypothetical protein